MGIDSNGAKFLFYARKHGVSFAETAVIGRQAFLIDGRNLSAVSHQFGRDLSIAESERLISESDGYIESFLKTLEAAKVDSFDASSYENATDIHDFNQPIPEIYKNKYSAVLDGGTLEHIFDFPAAIKNCMEMVKVGGHFLAITPSNNHFGHGFYQFSPELFYRIFTQENGFEIPKIFVYEDAPDSDWFEVADPDKVGERVTLVNDHPCLLLVIARKVSIAEIFASSPQQSDYTAAWSGIGETPHEDGRLGASLPVRAVNRLQRGFNRAFGMLSRRPQHFKKFDPTQ